MRVHPTLRATAAGLGLACFGLAAAFIGCGSRSELFAAVPADASMPESPAAPGATCHAPSCPQPACVRGPAKPEPLYQLTGGDEIATFAVSGTDVFIATLGPNAKSGKLIRFSLLGKPVEELSRTPVGLVAASPAWVAYTDDLPDLPASIRVRDRATGAVTELEGEPADADARVASMNANGCGQLVWTTDSSARPTDRGIHVWDTASGTTRKLNQLTDLLPFDGVLVDSRRAYAIRKGCGPSCELFVTAAGLFDPTATPLWSKSEDQSTVSHQLLAANDAFIVGSMNGGFLPSTLVAIPKCGGDVVRLAQSGYPAGMGPAAADDSHVYFVDYDKKAIERVPVAGGAAETVVSLPPLWNKLAVDGCNLYWQEGDPDYSPDTTPKVMWRRK